MSELTNKTVEESLGEKWGDVKSAVTSRLQEGESYVRQEPWKAVLYASAVGYILRILPLGAIARSFVRILLIALKPAAFLYGAAKTYEILVNSKKS